MDAENKDSCLQKDSAEHEGYVRARRSFNQIWKERDSAQPKLLEKILYEYSCAVKPQFRKIGNR